MKRKLETIFLILIILLSVLTIKVPANAFEDSQATGIKQEEIKNKQYLVTDDYIARISPKTEVESFVMQFELKDKEIVIYEDENKEVEIKEGLITTGMIMTVKDLVDTNEYIKEKDYELSVWGDINQDGYSNILEVVNIINHIVGVEGEEITGIKFVSSDLNEDGKVNIVDLNKLIRYIVFQELEIGETKLVESPSIEIKETEINGWHNKDVKVVIKTNEANFQKTIYSINGKMVETTNKEEEILLTQEGTYKIQAFTSSENNSESNVVQKEIKIDKQAPIIESIKKSTEEETEKPVIIEIKSSDNLSGLDDEAYSFDGGLSWQKENYKEYKENQEKIEIRIRDNAGNIKSEIASIENIINVERTEFEVVFKNYNGDVLQTTKVEKGNVPSYQGKAPRKTLKGYNCRFIGWDKPIQLVTEDIEYVATFTDKIIEYSINYELNGGTLNSENPSSYNVETETFTLKNPQKDEYTFIGWSLEGEEDLNEEVIIEKGNIGNRKYIANWEETIYVAKNEEKNKEYASINLAIEDAEEGQTIILQEDTKREVKVPNGKKVILDLNGKVIATSNIDKPTLINNGKLTIIDSGDKEGIIKNAKGKAIVNEANALLNMGILDDQIKLIPCIEGKTLGIENNGIFNYYDGTIIGNRAIMGNINSTPEGYNLLIGQTTSGTKQQIKLGLLEDAEAKIGEMYYLTLAAAIKSINIENNANPEQETITILKDIQISSKIDIKSKANIRLDLNNKQIIDNSLGLNNSYIDALINNMGKLEITDLSEEKGGNITTTASDLLINNEAKGEIIISGGRLAYENTKGSSYYYNTAINNQGKLYIVDGEICSSSYFIYLINNSGELNVSGGTTKLESSTSYYYSGICIKNNNKVKVTGGKLINTQGSGIILSNYGDAIIINDDKNAETIELEIQGSRLIDNKSDGTVTLNNIKLELGGSSSIINNGKNISIIKSEINSNGEGIRNENGTLEIIEGVITAKEYAIYNCYGTVVIEDSTVETTEDYYEAVYNTQGTIIVKSGNVSSKRYGIYNERGTVTIGINDGKIYPTQYPNKNLEEKYPTIKGKRYAIYNYNGTLNYYDGMLFGTEGVNKIVYGTINSIADIFNENNESIGKYTILYNSLESSLEYYAMLGLEPICRILDENGKPIKDENRKEILYYNLKEAFDNCDNGYTMQILIETTCDEILEISEGKNIKIDLNGNKITSTNSECFIINNGNLEIFDSEETEKSIITSALSKCVIENNGILKISGGNISSSKSGTSENYDAVIKNNNGELVIEGGKVSSTGYYTYTIENKAEVKIIKGIIEGNNPISNYGNVTIGGFTEEINSIQTYGNLVNNESGQITIKQGTIEKITNQGNGKISVHDELNDTDITTIDNKEQATLNIYGGHIGIINNSNQGIIEINQGDITGGVNNSNNGSIKIIGGIIENVTNTGAGTVTITGGTIRYTSSYTLYAIKNLGVGEIEILGGNIKGKISGVYNEGEGTINVKGGYITGEKHGIYNINKGTIKVLAGKVIGDTVGIYNRIGTLNLGLDDEELYPKLDVNAEEKYPIIKGVEYGIRNEGTFNYYDGIVYVDETAENAILGSIDDKASIFENNERIGKYDAVFKDTEGEHYAILDKMPVCKVLNSNNEVLTDKNENEILYYNFEDAIDDSLEDYTIQLIRTMNYSNRIEILEGKKIKLDLNGFKITSSNKECLIDNRGNLEILDSSNKGTGEIISINCAKIIENNGRMKVISGTIHTLNNGTKDIYNCAIKNNSGTLIVEGGTIEAEENYYYINTIENYGELIVKGGIISGYNSIQNYGNATINSGQVDETLQAGEVGNIINNNNGTMTLNIGNVVFKEYINITNNDNGTMTINNATISGTINNNSNNESTINTGNINTINNKAAGIININECTVNNQISNSNTGTINIKGGTIDCYSYNTTITNSGIGVVNIEGTTIVSQDNGVYNAGKGTVNIKETTIQASDYGIYNYGAGTFNIEKTNIESQRTSIYNIANGEINIVESKAISTGNNYYGIYNKSGTINIGEKDSEEVKNITEIKSMTKYGLYNVSGIINFYDGIIIGKTEAVYGEINEIPEGYGIKSEIKTIELVEGFEVYRLEKIEELLLDTDANIEIIYYNNLQNAINACTNSEDVIILQRDVVIEDKIAILQGKTINIDLNGFTIEGSIENNGTLNIKNTKGTIEEGDYGTITGSGIPNIQ